MIQLQNAQRKVRLSLGELRAFCARALDLVRAEPAGGESVLATLAEVHVVLVSDRRIAALHRQFMDIEGPTDVITFQHGEIFVSTETAARQAREFGSELEEEVRLYILHGLLHLHGYDDHAPAEAARMETTQRRLLAATRARAV